eukprot:1186145-Prorocentrum_minimum.AAC.1
MWGVAVCLCRECPSDLHEAVATVMFVAVRVTDLPELNQITEQALAPYDTYCSDLLGIKYGKVFVQNASTEATALAFGVNKVWGDPERGKIVKIVKIVHLVPLEITPLRSLLPRRLRFRGNKPGLFK